MPSQNGFGGRLLALVLAAMSAGALAQEQAKPVVNNRLEKVQATVEAIDAGTRSVTLKGAQGLVSVAVSPDVKNFDKLHVGDQVTVSYYKGIAARMVKGDAKAPAAAVFDTPAKSDAHPGGGGGASTTSWVTIQAVDAASNTVAFKRADGSVQTLEVQAPQMRQFIRTLKPGDVVEVTYTESVAVDVVPAN